MITQKIIDNYNYMIKASEGILLIKPFEKLQNKITYNVNYRELSDILNDIDKIFDTCKCIGIGVNPYTYEVFNQSCLSYPYLYEILNKINQIFPHIKILLSCSIEEINSNNIKLLKSYNIKLVLHINDLNKNILKYNNLLKEENDFIQCILTPYITNIKILKQYNCQIIYFYNFIQENFKNILSLNKNTELKKHFNYYEDIKCTPHPVILSLNTNSTDFFVGDMIVAINDIPTLCIEDFYEIIKEGEKQVYNFSIVRNGHLFNFFINTNQEEIISMINFAKMLEKIRFCEIIRYNNYFNEKMAIITKHYNSSILRQQLSVLNQHINVIECYNDQLSFKIISSLLQEYRIKHPQEIITTLLISKELFDLNIEEKTIEEFQMENLILLIFV